MFERIDSFESAFDIVAKAHDPDRVVSTLNHDATVPLEQVQLADILSYELSSGDRHVGVGILEAARIFAYDQLRFVRQTPLRVGYIDPVPEIAVESAILYGALPHHASNAFLDAIGEDAARISIGPNSLYEPLFGGTITPRSISQYLISFSRRMVVGCIRTNDALDALTIWNAGTLNEHVIPLPLGAPFSEGLLRQLADHIREQSIQEVDVIRAGRISDEELRTVCESFAGRRVVVYDYKNLPPTRFDRRSSAHGTVRTALLQLEESKESVEVDLITPRLMSHDSWRYGEPRYINEVAVNVHDPGRLPTAVLPPKIRRFWTRPFPLLDFRVSDVGLCLLAKRAPERESIPLPDATTIVRKFLEGRGFDTSVSSQGLAFLRLLSLTNGAITWLNHPHMRDLLRLFEPSGTGDEHSYADSADRVVNWAAIKRAVPDQPEKSLKLLLDAHLIEAGIQLQCDTCGGRELYIPAEIRSEVECKRCQVRFAPPFENQSAMNKWAYRLMPPFDHTSTRRGLLGLSIALPVLNDSPGEKTIAAGICVSRPGQPETSFEIDLIGLQRRHSDLGDVVPLFLETKYGASFSRIDIARMAFLRRFFPYGVFGFSTIQPVEEIGPHALRRIRAFSRLKDKQGEISHSTMLLTARELRPSFESIETRDHILGFFQEIAYETTKRHLESSPSPYTQWKHRHDELNAIKRTNRTSKMTRKARSMRSDSLQS